jgi:exosortase
MGFLTDHFRAHTIKAVRGGAGRYAALPIVLVLGVLWSLWPVLRGMVDRWASDPRYAHGYLVPLFAVALLAMRRGRLAAATRDPSLWGLASIALAAAIELVGAHFHSGPIEGISLLPYLAGITLLTGGWGFLAWAWPAIAFLAFMVPLPWRLENALGTPLQSVASAASTYLLQTLGLMAFAEGNVIHLNEARIGIVEACSGLSMVITFLALSTAAAMVVKRPIGDRLALVASAIPVALLANIARIVLTGVLHDRAGSRLASAFYHDVAGWVMIPLALVMYWLEIWILARLLVETKYEAPIPLGLGQETAAARPRAASDRFFQA